MKKTTTYLGLIFIGAMMPMASGCHDDGPSASQSDAGSVTFVPSRADDEADDRHPLTELYDSYYDKFSVWGTYCTPTNTSRVRIFDKKSYQVSFDENLWVYKSVEQPALYWNASAKDYRFHAVASKPERQVDVSYTSSSGYTILVGAVKGNVKALPEHELLCAYDVRHVNDAVTPLRGYCDQDMYKTDAYIAVNNLYDPANLVFHHVLSAIEFRVDAETQSAHHVTSIDASISKSISTEGTYSVAAMEWKNLSGTATELPTVEIIDGTDTFEQVLEIPQSVDGCSMSLSVTADTGTYTGTLPLTTGWLPGKRYVYTISISSTDEKILVDVAVEPYQGHVDIDVEDELTNW